MPRTLSEKDIEILKKLAPECTDLDCAGSGMHYKSILPPLANHFSTSGDDFLRRIYNLDDTDLNYLLELIKNGSESLGCVPAHYLQIFINMVTERAGEDKAKEIVSVHMRNPICDL